MGRKSVCQTSPNKSCWMRVYSHRLTWHAFQWMKCSFCAFLTPPPAFCSFRRFVPDWVSMPEDERRGRCVRIAERLLKAPQSLQINGSDSIFGGFSSANGGFIKKATNGSPMSSFLCKQLAGNWDTDGEMDPRLPSLSLSPPSFIPLL